MSKPFFSCSRKLSFLYPSYLIWNIKTEKKELFLSFDDGPTEQLTFDILELLKSFNVKATFFCVGHNIQKYPNVFREIIEEKHAVGNHTFNHLNGWKTPLKKYLNDVEKCRELCHSAIFRPPHGRLSFRQAAHLKSSYNIYMWSVLTYDFHKNIHPEECLNISKKNTRNGDIVVFHDNIKAQQNMLYALPKFIEYYLEKGFSFGLLDK